MPFTLRVHVDQDTVDITGYESQILAKKDAEKIAKVGVWNTTNTKFYPAKNLIYMELMEVK